MSSQGEIHIIPPEGPIIIAVMSECPSLEKLQEIVGGYIEMTNCVQDGERRVMIVNEDSDGLAINERATDLYQAHVAMRFGRRFSHKIVGTVVVLVNVEMN